MIKLSRCKALKQINCNNIEYLKNISQEIKENKL